MLLLFLGMLHPSLSSSCRNCSNHKALTHFPVLTQDSGHNLLFPTFKTNLSHQRAICQGKSQKSHCIKILILPGLPPLPGEPIPYFPKRSPYELAFWSEGPFLSHSCLPVFPGGSSVLLLGDGQVATHSSPPRGRLIQPPNPTASPSLSAHHLDSPSRQQNTG